MGKLKKRSSSFIDNGDSGDAGPVKVNKKIKTNTNAGEVQKDDDGNKYWDLSAKRRVNISTFNKMQLVNIREYYEAGGEMKPGKKGISLSVEQFQAFLKAVPGITRELRKAGHEIDGLDASAEALESPKPSEKTAKPSKKKETSKPKAKAKKANIEATSDEEEEEELKEDDDDDDGDSE